MAQTLLAVWNIALSSVGERSLSSTADSVESRRILNEVWDRGKGAISYLLEQGVWSFATTRAAPTAATSTAAYGFAYSFALPTDFVRMADISTDVDNKNPHTHYEVEGARLYSASSLIYMRYVSSSTDFGGNLANWPDSFALYGGHWLGTQIAPRLTNDIDMTILDKRANDMLVSARLKDMTRTKKLWPPQAPNDLDHRRLDYAIELLGMQPKREQG